MTNANGNAPKSSIHPLMAAAAGAVVLVSGLGAAAMLGWLPSSSGHNVDPSVGPNGQPLTAQTAGAPGTASGGTAVIAAPVGATAQHSSPVHHAPEHRAAEHVAAAAPAECRDCGVIESVHEVDTKGEGSGVGAVGGAVVGGLLGNQVGSGNGRKLATLAGAIGGAVAGNQIEGRVKASHSYDINVRLNDGTVRTFHQTEQPSWHNGDQVRVVDGALRANG